VDAKDYNDYILLEFENFVKDPSRARASLEATAPTKVERVLDVGCGAGQELLPFVRDGNALGLGIDIAPTTGQVGTEKLARHAPKARVRFVRGSAENLSFPDGVFDTVICRLALPYTHNARALAEASRVLRPGGLYLLKIHGVRFYFDLLRRAIRSRKLMPIVYACRVLVAGSIYHLSGRQSRTRIPSTETFQSEWLLRRELSRCGLAILGKTPDSNSLTPSFVILKSE
jgi:ubiquinone/menaquinone biosynthesis C-methylase UbiE